jgi:hypothetical protein
MLYILRHSSPVGRIFLDLNQMRSAYFDTNYQGLVTECRNRTVGLWRDPWPHFTRKERQVKFLVSFL